MTSLKNNYSKRARFHQIASPSKSPFPILWNKFLCFSAQTWGFRRLCRRLPFACLLPGGTRRYLEYISYYFTTSSSRIYKGPLLPVRSFDPQPFLFSAVLSVCVRVSLYGVIRILRCNRVCKRAYSQRTVDSLSIAFVSHFLFLLQGVLSVLWPPGAIGILW